VTVAPAKPAQGQRLLVVSNRGPVEFDRDKEGKLVAVPGRGGLSTALYAAALARLAPMVWLSSPLTPAERELAETGCAPDTLDGASRFVITDSDAYELFYGCFANEVLWFLQHGLPWPEELTPERREKAWEEGYLVVNQAFANAVVKELDRGDFRAVMFHDYLFYAAPALVRAAKPDVYLQHFIHIPWPDAEEWSRLEPDIVREIYEGLLANDSLVFQTAESADNFLLAARSILPSASVDAPKGTVTYGGHTTRVWADPISADPEELAQAAASPEFSHYRYLLRAEHQKMIIRVDRLDPTKNVYRGFQAYERLFEEHPELRERVTFLALLVPTKSSIPAYQRYQEETLALAESINRRFGNHHWKPIRVQFEHNRIQALAAMSLYDILLVNPIADGMNLVAKEGPMLNSHDGVLVLSRTAGAYFELADGVIEVEPEDVDGTAEALYRGLTLPPAERWERAGKLKRMVRQHTLRDWFRELLDDIDKHAPVSAAR
jgi:trehalose 6-phosphate synthase